MTVLRPFIHGGKDQHKSCTAHHGEPLLCPCLRNTCYFFFFFLVIFLGWVMLLHPQATSTDHGGPRTSDLSIERRRRNHVSTAPKYYCQIQKRHWILAQSQKNSKPIHSQNQKNQNKVELKKRRYTLS